VQGFEGSWQERMVTVNAYKPHATGRVIASIASSSYTSIARMPDDFETRVIKLSQDLQSVVGGTIINNNQFKILKRLSYAALDTTPDLLGAIVNGHDNAKKRRCHIYASRVESQPFLRRESPILLRIFQGTIFIR